MAENDSWNNGSAQNRGFSNAGNGANGMNGRSSQAVRDALFDRVPPHDDAAEMAVLGGMLMSKDAIGEVSQMIDVSDFYQPRNQTVYEAVIKLFSASQPVDAVLVANELLAEGNLEKVGGSDYLHSLVASVPTAANATYYADIVHQRAILRNVIAAGTKIAQLGYTAEGSQAEDVVNLAQAEVYEMSTGKVRQDYAPIGTVIADTLDQLDRLQSGEVSRGVPTGFRDIDDVTQGLQPGQMIVVAGRPAMGKSTLGVDFARSAALHHGLTTIIFSLEMSKNELAQRIISAESNIPLAAMRRADDITPERWAILNELQGKLQNAPLFIEPEHEPDGNPREMPPTEADERFETRRHRLPAAHDLRQGRGKPPAGSVRLLPCAEAARQGAGSAGGGTEPAEPWPRNASGQEAAAVRPA